VRDESTSEDKALALAPSVIAGAVATVFGLEGLLAVNIQIARLTGASDEVEREAVDMVSRFNVERGRPAMVDDASDVTRLAAGIALIGSLRQTIAWEEAYSK
jgi:hypothetical protein